MIEKLWRCFETKYRLVLWVLLVIVSLSVVVGLIDIAIPFLRNW